MKNFYVAIQVDYTGEKSLISGDEYNNGNRAMYAFVEVYRTGTNLVRALEIIGGLVSATLCDTRKQADELVAEWNRGFRESGIYAF